MSTRSSATVRRATIASSAATPPPAIRTRCRYRLEFTLFAPPAAVGAALPAVGLPRDGRKPVDDRLPGSERPQVVRISDDSMQEVVEPAALEHEDDLVAGQIDRVTVEPELVRVERRARLDELGCALFGVWLELRDHGNTLHDCSFPLPAMVVSRPRRRIRAAADLATENYGP